MKFPWMRSEEDFVVEEVADKKFTRRFRRAARVERMAGRYALCAVTKRGITTHEAALRIAKRFGCAARDIGYAGLKDKFAIATQYMTVRGAAESFDAPSLSARVIGSSDKPMRKGDLEANKFSIRLPARAKAPSRVVVANLFGSQRFGRFADNHLIGRALLQKRFEDALGMIKQQRHVQKLHQAPKELLKFYVNAYQSHVFNKAVPAMRTYFGYVTLPGYMAKPAGRYGAAAMKLLAKDGIALRDFRIDELRLRVDGAKRRAFISAKIKQEGGRAVFTLPAGSYASVVIDAIVKRKLG